MSTTELKRLVVGSMPIKSVGTYFSAQNLSGGKRECQSSRPARGTGAWQLLQAFVIKMRFCASESVAAKTEKKRVISPLRKRFQREWRQGDSNP